MEQEKTLVRIKRTQKNYSLAFKLQVVDEVEKGYLTYRQAQMTYGIQGHCTVLKWLRKHGRLNWDNGGNLDHKKTPYHKIKELEKKVKELELDKEILNRTIDIADEMFNSNIRKKFLSESYKNIKKKNDQK